MGWSLGLYGVLQYMVYIINVYTMDLDEMGARHWICHWVLFGFDMFWHIPILMGLSLGLPH